jgi:hypothetical protein
MWYGRHGPLIRDSASAGRSSLVETRRGDFGATQSRYSLLRPEWRNKVRLPRRCWARFLTLHRMAICGEARKGRHGASTRVVGTRRLGRLGDFEARRFSSGQCTVWQPRTGEARLSKAVLVMARPPRQGLVSPIAVGRFLSGQGRSTSRRGTAVWVTLGESRRNAALRVWLGSHVAARHYKVGRVQAWRGKAALACTTRQGWASPGVTRTG